MSSDPKSRKTEMPRQFPPTGEYDLEETSGTSAGALLHAVSRSLHDAEIDDQFDIKLTITESDNDV